VPAIVFGLALAAPAADAPLVARLEVSAGEGGVPLTVRFDATASRAATGAPLAFAWRFGDGTAVRRAGAVVEHTYTRRGVFVARVTVRDGRQRATARVRIVVEGHGRSDAPSVAGGVRPAERLGEWGVGKSELFLHSGSGA
jgi:PKD domain-containing protein